MAFPTVSDHILTSKSPKNVFISRSFNTTSMGKPERKNRERTGYPSSYFLRCFGISCKIHSEKPMLETAQDKKMKKTRSHWLSRPIKSRLKTGEITPTAAQETEKQNSNVEDDKQNLFQVKLYVTDRKNIASSDCKAVEQTSQEKNTNEQRDINPDPLSLSGKYETYHKDLSTTSQGHGKIDLTKTIEAGPKLKSPRVRKRLRVGSFDPVIGIIIIMITLVIMLTWGRLCAIICTSTWCYFLPRIKEAASVAKRKRSGGGKAEGGLFPSDFDLNSEAYKKKVVMEGFLVRPRRVSI